MADGPIAVPFDRLDDLVALANRVFRPGGGDMGREYPLVFDSGALDGMRVILDEGRVVSHVGVCVRDASLLGAPLRVASIGAVCTDPECRGRGYAGALMEDAIARARDWGAHLMLISGDRRLYRRMGGIRPGRFTHIEMAEADLPLGLTLDRAAEEDIPDLAALYQREPVRFIRSHDDWRRLLEAGMLMNHAGDCWIIRDSEEALGYVAVQRPPSHSEGETRPNAREYAGSREAVWAALGALAGRYGSSSIVVALMPDDRDMHGRARRAGALLREGNFGGTVRLLDVASLIERLLPLWRERVGSEAVNALQLQADRDSLSFVADGGRVGLEGPAATAALFGPERGHEEEYRALPGIEPLPLFWYGYNYV